MYTDETLLKYWDDGISDHIYFLRKLLRWLYIRLTRINHSSLVKPTI